MPKKELIDYINQSIGLGYSFSQIRQSLQQSGYAQADIEDGLRYYQGNGASQPDKIGFFTKTKLILFSPKTLFEKVKNESDLIHAFNFYAIWNIVLFLPLTLIFAFISLKQNPSFSMVQAMVASLLPVILIFTFIFSLYSLFLPFAIAGYFFVALKWLFKIKTSFTESYKALIYSMLQLYAYPSLIGLIFVLAAGALGTGIIIIIILIIILIATLIYNIYTLTVGLSVLNDVSKLKAFLVIMLPLLIITILVAWLLLGLWSTLNSLGTVLSAVPAAPLK